MIQINDGGNWSPLTQGRGLKSLEMLVIRLIAVSPLTQGRGLKCSGVDKRTLRKMVAPHAGAWIEIHLKASNTLK